uniref:hypothetical protein n=1 Tax=Pseudomonas chlororaphis TaxID=587753 RepID=UPI00048EFF99
RLEDDRFAVVNPANTVFQVDSEIRDSGSMAVAIKYLAHRGKHASGKGRTTMSHAVRAFSGDST